MKMKINVIIIRFICIIHWVEIGQKYPLVEIGQKNYSLIFP